MKRKIMRINHKQNKREHNFNKFVCKKINKNTILKVKEYSNSINSQIELKQTKKFIKNWGC